jgi:hypothetical protein
MFAVGRINLCGASDDRRTIVILELAIEVGQHRAKFPCLKFVPDQRAVQFYQRPHVAEIHNLLQREIRPLLSQKSRTKFAIARPSYPMINDSLVPFLFLVEFTLHGKVCVCGSPCFARTPSCWIQLKPHPLPYRDIPLAPNPGFVSPHLLQTCVCAKCQSGPKCVT